jgi:hypothetical protein
MAGAIIAQREEAPFDLHGIDLSFAMLSSGGVGRPILG